MSELTDPNRLKGIKSSGFIDGYKASNFESNSSIIKYHEEELSDLLKFLQTNLLKNNFGEYQSLIENPLKKASEKLVVVNNYIDAENSYIQSFSNFKDFLSTASEIKFSFNAPDQLTIKKILYHYKMLAEKTLLSELSEDSSKTEIEFVKKNG